MDCLLDGVVMAESLPLGVDRIDTSSGEESLLDKSLPVNLIFVFFTWEFLSHLKYLDKLSNCKSSSLP